VLHVEGHLDHDTVAVLRQRVAPYVGQPGRPIAFDLSRLRRMTSAGVGVFLNVRRAQERCGAACLFVNLPPPIRRVFDLMDAVRCDAMFASTREMDAYLEKLQNGAIDPLSQSVGTTSGSSVVHDLSAFRPASKPT
jgi:anti-sigma B factor antagonist